MIGCLQRVCRLMAGQRPLLLARVSQGQQRDLKEALDKDELPQKPVLPIKPFMKFFLLVRPTLALAHPEVSPLTHAKLAGENWRNLTYKQQQQFYLAYKEEKAVYLTALKEYEESLTKEQKQRLEEAKQELKQEKVKKKCKQKKKENLRPKRYFTPYQLYIKEIKEEKGGYASTSERMTQLHERWANLPEDEKALFKEQSNAMKRKYNQSLENWETKMIRLGNLDIVRKRSLKQELKKRAAVSQVTYNKLKLI